MYGEDVIYSFDNIRDAKTERLLPTALDMRLDVGFTNLSYLVSRDPDSWKALLERVEREGKATAQEIESMRNVIDGNELKGISEPLKMEIRLWASYQGQPFARTLDGLMNYAHMLRIFLRRSIIRNGEEPDT